MEKVGDSRFQGSSHHHFKVGGMMDISIGFPPTFFTTWRGANLAKNLNILKVGLEQPRANSCIKSKGTLPLWGHSLGLTFITLDGRNRPIGDLR